jgi:hypothetical protein
LGARILKFELRGGILHQIQLPEPVGVSALKPGPDLPARFFVQNAPTFIYLNSQKAVIVIPLSDSPTTTDLG